MPSIPEAGVWVAYDVELDFSEGWVRGPLTSYERFRNDVLDIDWLGLYVVRSAGTEEMLYGIDDFRVRGWRIADRVDDPTDADENGIPDEREDFYGLQGLDDDGDGMSNYAEWRAGTNPTNDNSRFRIDAASRIHEPVDRGVALTWDAIPYRAYSVWKSTNLFEDFTRGTQIVNYDVEIPVHEYVDTAATNSGPYFYRVSVEE